MNTSKFKATEQKQIRKQRTRRRLKQKSDRLRLSVFKSANHIYAQVIDDKLQATLISSSTLLKEFKASVPPLTGIAAAKWVGKDIALKASQAGIKQVVFDKGSFLFHGRIKALAESARENGLDF